MSGDEDDVHLDQRAGDDFQNDVLDPHTLSMRSHLSLSQAARSGDVARFRDLLADACDPNAHDSLRHYSMTVALVEAVRHSQRDIVDLLISQDANVDGPNVDTSLSPLMAALEEENIYVILKHLSHMRDLKILGQVQDAYCWRFATYLIMNHAISTESVLRALPRSEMTRKRLRCALFDAGADIRLSTDTNNPSHKACSVRRPAVSGGHLDKGKATVTGNHPMSHTVTELSQNFAEILGFASNASECLRMSIDIIKQKLCSRAIGTRY